MRDPTLFPPPGDESDDAPSSAPGAAGSDAPSGSPGAAGAAGGGRVPGRPDAVEGGGPRRLRGAIRAADRGSSLTAPSQRRIEAPTPHRLRDVDTANQAQNIRGCAWAGYMGILMGFVFVAAGYMAGVSGVWYLPLYALGWVVGTAGAFFVGNWSVSAIASGFSTLYGGRNSIKPVRHYSLAESLKVRGDYVAARSEYERLFAADPSDHEPAARIARLWRDELNAPEEAAAWFRQALQVPGLPPGQALLLLRELVEVQVHRMGQPRRALPDLARVARTLPDTPAGTWAAAELARIKAEHPPVEDET